MKSYQNEKAIISLTSWKARIDTVSKTIFNLIKTCPDFHIVLVLSEDEFPNKEEELPFELNLILKNNYFELLWVKKNYKAFKKVLFTLEKYKSVPIISADDDCYYTRNYANDLYTTWIKSGEPQVVRYTPRTQPHTQGPCTLYNINKYAREIINSLSEKQISDSKDDDVLTDFIKKKKINIVSTKIKTLPFVFHDDNSPLTKNQRKSDFYSNCFI